MNCTQSSVVVVVAVADEVVLLLLLLLLLVDANTIAVGNGKLGGIYERP